MGDSEEVFVIDGNTVTARVPEGKKGALPVVYLNVFQGDGAKVWGAWASLAARRSRLSRSAASHGSAI